MNKKLNFESLLGELSAELVNLPLGSLDAAIESSIKSLVEFFDADRCHLPRHRVGGGAFSASDQVGLTRTDGGARWQKPGIVP